MTVEPFAPRPTTPMLTMTLEALMNAEAPLARLLEVRMSAQLAYNVAKLSKAVGVEVQHFKDQRDALIKELGEPVDDPPGAIRVTAENEPVFMQRMRELAAVEVTLSFRPLRLADLPEMTGSDLLKLGPLVVDE